MRHNPFTPRPARAAILTIAALAFCFPLASCGGSDDAASGEAGTTEAVRSAEPAPGDGGKEPTTGQKGGSDRDGGGGGDAAFTPRSHEDSGGGSDSFRVDGGDNSVQEFGSEIGDEEFQQAATALHVFFDARAAGAWATACANLAANLAGSLEGRTAPDAEPEVSCARGLERMTNPDTRDRQRAEARGIDVGSLRADGQSGFLLYRDQSGTPYAIAVEKEDGRWRLANLAGLALA